MAKLCVIGAGSTVFTRRICTDMLLMAEFRDLQVALHDIDERRLAVSAEVIGGIISQLGLPATVTAHTDRRAALAGADFVLTAIQVGGYKPATVTDFAIPTRHGLRQTIGDTLGIGGIMRGLRTIPALLDIGRDIADVCPAATWFQYANPMCMNMIAIARELPGLKAVGLCHSVQLTAEMLAGDLGEDIASIDYECAGINHVAFFTRFGKRAGATVKDLYPRLREIAPAIVAGERASVRATEVMDHGRSLSERVRYDVLLRLGYFVTESSEHFAEYVPWFIRRDRPDLIERFAIPLDEYLDRCEASTRKWEDLAAAIGAQATVETHMSNEYAAEIARALVGGKPARFNGNVPNTGMLIPGLPEGCCVEVPITVDSGGMAPQAVAALPPQLSGLMLTNINVQLLVAEAVLAGKREHVHHAALLDPHTAAELTPDAIHALVEELLAAHGDYIPAALR